MGVVSGGGLGVGGGEVLFFAGGRRYGQGEPGAGGRQGGLGYYSVLGSF